MNLFIKKVAKNASAEYCCILELNIKGYLCASNKAVYAQYQNITKSGAYSRLEVEVFAIDYLDKESRG